MSSAILEKNVNSVQIDHGYETRRSSQDDNEDKFNKSKLIICTQESDEKSVVSNNKTENKKRIQR